MAKQASVSLLQRRLRIGYTRAARMIDWMKSNGIVSKYDGVKPRSILIYEDHNLNPSKPVKPSKSMPKERNERIYLFQKKTKWVKSIN